MKKPWLAVVTACLLTQYTISAQAEEIFIVKDIRIEGLQRITEGTVLNYLPIHIGDELPDPKTAEVLKALFETGFFQDIQLERENDVLVIRVVERPTIGKITVTGNKEITDENLKTTLKTAGLAEGYVFDRSTLEQVSHELERLYFSHGKYSVKLDTVVEKQDRNRVSVSITIDEGVAAHIKAIQVTGNQQFPEDALLKSFTLAPTNILSWVSQSDQYDKQKLSADLESLRTFYLDRGYLNYQILSTQVSITPDKQDIFITVNTEEGQQYVLKSFSVAGQTILPEEELRKFIIVKEGEIFSRSKVAESVKFLTDRLGQEGYAFAKVNPVPDIQEAEKTVNLTFFFEPGNKIYVRRVLFEGNTKTRDEVIRRELIQMESAAVNTKRIEESRTRLNRTGFFSEVKSDMRPVPGTTDQVDIIYTVVEASAGQLGGGVGFSDSDGLIFNANISNRNFLGTGNNVDFSFNQSKAYTTYSLSHNDPYYTDDGVSRGFNLFYSKTDLGNATSVANYTTDAYGANMTYGVPISPVDRFTFGYGYQNTLLKMNSSNIPAEIIYFLQTNDVNVYENQAPRFKSEEFNLAVGWMHNTFDRYIFPENGLMQSAGATIALPFSNLEYYRLSYNHQWFKSLGYGFIFTTSATLGYGDGYNDTPALPFYKNFFAGGSRTVRGFEESSLGPLDSLGNPFGGNFLAAASVGMVIPNFFIPETRSIRLSWFLDGGQVYDLKYRDSFTNPDQGRNPTGPRFSTGLSLTWMSPMAPLVFSYAIPLNKKDGDELQAFAFTFGTTF